MSHLVAHEWDAYGTPPPPGATYPAEPSIDGPWECQQGHAVCESARDCIDALEADAEDHESRADDLESEAGDERGRASDLYDAADEVRMSLGVKPKWSKTPETFTPTHEEADLG